MISDSRTMRNYTRDGGVVPSHVSDNPSMYSPGVRVGFISKVVYVGDKGNITGQLEYVVNILGHDYHGVLDASVAFGGIFNNHVRVRKGQETENKAVEPGAPEDKKNGDVVRCIMIEVDRPLIIASGPHPRVEENADYKKPTKALGQFERYEFNGVEFLIDKDGNLTVTQLGLKDPLTGKATPAQTGNLKLSKDGNLVFTTTKGAVLSVLDAEDKFIYTAKNGDTVWVSKADGVQVRTPAGGGTSASFKSGSIDLEGSLGKLKLKGGKVGLGASTAELLDLFDQTLAQIQLISVPTAVGPSGYPANAAAFAAIKTLLDGIKGGI